MDGLNIAPHAVADLRLSCGSMQISKVHHTAISRVAEISVKTKTMQDVANEMASQLPFDPAII
jgi:hypothetical protein